jgi:hypothetical protein
MNPSEDSFFATTRSTMKLPRWLGIGIVASSVLVVLAAAGWWWVTWPERTAREFVDLMAAEKSHDIWRMCAPHPADGLKDVIVIRGDGAAGWIQRGLQALPRSFADVLSGWQRFRLDGKWTFAIVRGKLDSKFDSAVFGITVGDPDKDRVLDLVVLTHDPNEPASGKRVPDDSK